MPSVVATPYGPDALAALREVVATHKGSDPLAPVTVIVPDNFVGISARRALASGDHGQVCGAGIGVIGVNFLTTYRLAEFLGAARLALHHRRPVSTPVIAAAIRSVLAQRPGIFAPVAEHPTTERRLVAAHRELSELSPAELDVLAAAGPRAGDVVGIHRMVTALLADAWYTEQDLLTMAAATVVEDPDRARAIGALVIHLPQDLSPARARFLQILETWIPVAVVAGLTGVAEADASVATALQRLGCEPPSPPPTPRTRFDITSVSDADDEVRHVIRGIVDAARSGVPFDRMAVVHASDEPYARLLHDHLRAAEIPFNGAAIATLAESTAGRLLRRLLALSDRDFRREDVAALLAGSPLRWAQGIVPSRAWEQISRDAGVVRGHDDWATKLAAHAADLRHEIERIGEDPEREWAARGLQRRVELTTAFAAFMADLVAELDRGRAQQSWTHRARWAQRLLRRYLGDQRDWPDAERRATERIDAVLQRLAGLDAVESSPTGAVFFRTLELELEGGLGRSGSFGNGVLVGPAWMSTGLVLDRVWILGLSEGTFPSRPREDSLLPDRERRLVRSLRPRGERTGDEHRQFLAALAAVGKTGSASLLRPRGDLRRSDERAPSRWLVDLVAERTGARPAGTEIDHLGHHWVRHVASFAGGVVATAFPATVQEYELRSLADIVDRGVAVDSHPLVADGPLALPVEAHRSRDSARFTRFDGNLAGVDTPDLAGTGRATSATALETWARCPHQYLVRHLLRVDPVDIPELRLRIDPLSRGRVMHEILERFVQERIDDPRGGQGHGWKAEDRARIHRIAGEVFASAHARGLTGAPVYWRRDQVRLRRDLEAFIAHDTNRRIDEGLTPIATELGFGIQGTAPVVIPLRDGSDLTLRGSIDLIDEDAAGNLVVIDYKTGATPNLTPENPHLRGTKLQLVLYGLAARQLLGRDDAEVTGLYWQIRAEKRMPRRGYRLTPEIQRSVLDAVATIVDGIRRGVFPPNPEETTRQGWVSCEYCDPDGLGTAEGRRRFVRKSAAPGLESYMALAEPALLAPATLPEDDPEPAPHGAGDR